MYKYNAKHDFHEEENLLDLFTEKLTSCKQNVKLLVEILLEIRELDKKISNEIIYNFTTQQLNTLQEIPKTETYISIILYLITTNKYKMKSYFEKEFVSINTIHLIELKRRKILFN